MLRALARAIASLAHPKMLLLMVLPVAAALVLWLVAGVFFWREAVDAVGVALEDWHTLDWLLTYWPLTLIAAHAAVAILLLLMVPVIVVTTVLIVGIFAMPLVVSHVSARSYADLALRGGATWWPSLWNSVVALLIFLVLAAVTLPLWLFPPLWPALSLGLLGYLNQRVMRFDALVEHAAPEELSILFAAERWSLFALGVVVALATHVPVLGFFAPVFGSLVFVHYLLDRLRTLRVAPLEGEARRISE